MMVSRPSGRRIASVLCPGREQEIVAAAALERVVARRRKGTPSRGVEIRRIGAALRMTVHVRAELRAARVSHILLQLDRIVERVGAVHDRVGVDVVDVAAAVAFIVDAAAPSAMKTLVPPRVEHMLRFPIK